jgi:hypothetical protein
MFPVLSRDAAHHPVQGESRFHNNPDVIHQTFHHQRNPLILTPQDKQNILRHFWQKKKANMRNMYYYISSFDLQIDRSPTTKTGKQEGNRSDY